MTPERLLRMRNLVNAARRSSGCLDDTDLLAECVEYIDELLEACKQQHEAIDWLFAALITADHSFMPSKSPVWPACVAGNEAIKKAEGRS